MEDTLIACCDGLTGLPEAIEATWPTTTVQTCVVHVIRAAMRYVSYSDRKAFTAALKAVSYSRHTAARRTGSPVRGHAEAAETALLQIADAPLGKKYPASIKVFTDAWEQFIPFLVSPPAGRKLIYTTNSIESLNYQLRKVTKSRRQFPTDTAVTKLLWLAIINIEDKRATEREKARAKRAAGQTTKQAPRPTHGRPARLLLKGGPASHRPALPRPPRRPPLKINNHQTKPRSSEPLHRQRDKLEQHIAGGPLHQGDDLALPAGIDDQGRPVPGHRPVVDLGGTLTDVHHPVMRACFGRLLPCGTRLAQPVRNASRNCVASSPRAWQYSDSLESVG